MLKGSSCELQHTAVVACPDGSRVKSGAGLGRRIELPFLEFEGRQREPKGAVDVPRQRQRLERLCGRRGHAIVVVLCGG
jgi:hypothetical protein